MKRKVLTRYLGISISPEMNDQLTKLSRQWKYTKAEMVRMLIQQSLDFLKEEDNSNDEK